MRISLRFRLGLVLALAAALAGCQGPCSSIERINGPALSANGVDLSTYVAVGTSLTSGYESGGLVDRHQMHSFPVLFARQIGKSAQIDGKGQFTFPSMTADGVPALVEVKSYDPLLISNTGRVTGGPANLLQPFAYHNLGIPGAILLDLIDTTHYHSTVPPVNRTNFTYFDLIQRGRGSLLAQALSLQPTILSLEYGANELLGPTATAGVAPSPATGVTHAFLMTTALDLIHTASPATRVAVFNVPDVTSIPFFTTLSPFTVSATTGQPLPLIGANGPLGQSDLILLKPGADSIAIGTGIPPGGVNYLNPPAGSNGRPLPESVILRAAEVAATQAEVAKMNAVVDSVALRPNVVAVDLHGMLADIHANGYRLGGEVYTSAFVTGGLFSLDGIHPSDLGYALMANKMIEAVNAGFGCAVPPVNPAEYATATASRARPVMEQVAPLETTGLTISFEMLFPYRR